MADAIRVHADELDEVRRHVAPFVTDDERDPRGSVRLQASDGHRWWVAYRPGLLVALEGGADSSRVDIQLPKRILRAQLSGDVRLTVGERTEDGAYRQPATAVFDDLSVEFWPNPRDGGDWEQLLDLAMTTEGAVAEVERAALIQALDVLRHPPYDLDAQGEGWPPVRLSASPGQLELEVRWPGAGPTAVTLAARSDAVATGWVMPDGLAAVAAALGDGNATITLPSDPRGLVVVGCERIRAVLGQAPQDADLLPHLNRLEEVLAAALGLDEPERDADGDYPIRVGDSQMYLRVARRAGMPPVVQVFAILVDHADLTPELLEELNALNASTAFCRLFHVAGQVLAEDEIVATDLHPDELIASCDAVADAVRRFRPLLQARFGAADESVPTPVIPWAAFEETLVGIRTADGWTTFAPVDLPASESDAVAEWPFPDDAVVTVITGHNPMGQARGAAANDAAQDALVGALLELGRPFSQAVGVAMDGGWSEPSLAVVDLPRPEALELARAFGQASVFELTAAELRIVSCVDGQVRSSRPWRAEPRIP